MKGLGKVSDPTLMKQLWWQECCQKQHSSSYWIQWYLPWRCREGESHFCWWGASGLAAGWKADLGEVGAAGPANTSSHLDLGVKTGARFKHRAISPSFPLPPSQASPGDVPAWPAATAQPRVLPETKTSSRALEAAWDPSSGLFLAQVPGSSGSVCKINSRRSSCGSRCLPGRWQGHAAGWFTKPGQSILQSAVLKSAVTHGTSSLLGFLLRISSEPQKWPHSTEFACLSLQSLLCAENTPKFKGQEQPDVGNKV